MAVGESSHDHAYISKRLRNYWKKHGTSILNKPVAFKPERKKEISQ